MKLGIIVIVLLFVVVKEAVIGKFLRYDVECPFLMDDEYKARLRKGRCPPLNLIRFFFINFYGSNPKVFQGEKKKQRKMTSHKARPIFPTGGEGQLRKITYYY